MSDASQIEVERLGGFAGFGGPGARIRSRGRLPWSALGEADRQALGEHLLRGKPAPAVGAAAGPPVADGFRYRISATVQGRACTVELPEAQVPAVLQGCVTDELI